MKKSELRQLIEEELLESFKGNDFPLDKGIDNNTVKLFENILKDAEKMTSNSNNKDYVLASLYWMLEGALDHGDNAKYWRRMK